ALFINHTATTDTYTLSLHDALPILYTLTADNTVKQQAVEVTGKSGNNYIVKSGVSVNDRIVLSGLDKLSDGMEIKPLNVPTGARSEEHTSELQSRENLVCRLLLEKK